jgi:hypothetical protein
MMMSATAQVASADAVSASNPWSRSSAAIAGPLCRIARHYQHAADGAHARQGRALIARLVEHRRRRGSRPRAGRARTSPATVSAADVLGVEGARLDRSTNPTRLLVEQENERAVAGQPTRGVAQLEGAGLEPCDVRRRGGLHGEGVGTVGAMPVHHRKGCGTLVAHCDQRLRTAA